jgi:hypothetical protein
MDKKKFCKRRADEEEPDNNGAQLETSLKNLCLLALQWN